MGGIADVAGGFIGDVAGGLLGTDDQLGANKSATNAQLQGIRESNALQRDLFNAQSGMSSFQRGIGNQALNQLAGLYGIQGGWDPASSWSFDENGKLVETKPGAIPMGAGASGTPNYSAFFSSPDYAFALEQGQQGLDRAAAAGGSLFGGNRLKEAARFNQGLASQQYGSYFNRLAGLAGVGQTANAQVSNALSNAGNNISNGLMNIGSTRASGYQNAGAINANAREQGLNLALTGAAAFFSDRRLKSKIERIGTLPSGLPWYRYEIFGQPSEGVMADEVMQVNPDAVSTHESGYLMVDYGAI